MRKKRKSEKKQSGIIVCVVKALLISLAITLLLIALLSFLLYKGLLGIESVPVLSTIIKVVGAVVCASITVLSVCQKRTLLAALSGTVYIITSFVAFSAFCGEFNVSLGLLSDMSIGLCAGILSSFVIALVKK